MAMQRYHYYVLLIALAISGYLAYIVVRPFLISIFLAVVLAALLHPMYKRLAKKLNGRTNWSALLVCLLVIFIIILPSISLIFVLGKESVSTYNLIQRNIQSGFFEELLQPENNTFISRGWTFVLDNTNIEEFDFNTAVGGPLQEISTFLVQQGTRILTESFNLLFHFFIMIFTLFYLLKQGERLIQEMKYLSPLPDAHEELLFQKFKDVTSATLQGSLLTALAQGIVGGIIFFSLGLPSPVLWGSVMAFFALIPMVGTAIIWVPASIILFLTGHWVKAVILIVLGTFVIGLTDNLLRPFLIEGKTKMNPLIVFISILGGLSAFGFLGILIGPLLISIFITLIHLYRLEFKPELDQSSKNGAGV